MSPRKKEIVTRFAACPHDKGWRVVHKKKGVYRICKKKSCGMRILMLASPKGSFLEDYPDIKNRRPKGQHRRKDDKYDE